MLPGIITFLIIAVPVIGILYWSDRAKLKGLSKEQRERQKRENRLETKSAFFAIAIGAVILVIALVIGTQGRQVFRWVKIVVVPAAFLFVLMAVIWGRLKHRKTIRALKLAESGDLEGATTLIESAIEETPDSPDLWNTLGILQLEREQFEESLSSYERAESLGLDESIASVNKAIALLKLNRVDESLAINSVECQRHPENFIALANQCRILLASGQRAEAVDQLAVAEALYETQRNVQPNERKKRRELLDEIRVELAS